MLGTPQYETATWKDDPQSFADCLTLKKTAADGGQLQTGRVLPPRPDDTDYARVAGWRQSAACATPWALAS
jgi:hypothetical protein